MGAIMQKLLSSSSCFFFFKIASGFFSDGGNYYEKVINICAQDFISNYKCFLLKRYWGGRRGRMMEGVNLRSVVSTYANITMYPPVQLLYANKN
jgi:hypothetical protein